MDNIYTLTVDQFIGLLIGEIWQFVVIVTLAKLFFNARHREVVLTDFVRKLEWRLDRLKAPPAPDNIDIWELLKTRTPSGAAGPNAKIRAMYAKYKEAKGFS